MTAFCGSKFADNDRDGLRDPDEPLIPGWGINVTGQSETRTTTGAWGTYSFMPLVVGDYAVGEEDRDGWVQTYPDGGFHHVNLVEQQPVHDLDFGNSADSLCMVLSREHILCALDESGDYIYQFQLKNVSGVEVKYVLFPDPPDSCYYFARHTLTLDPPLADGDSITVRSRITGATPGDSCCFKLVLADALVRECCSDSICFRFPECDCLQIHDESLTWDLNNPEDLVFDFQMDNLFGESIYHSFLISPDSTITFDPDYFSLGEIEDNETASLHTTIHGADIGDTLCFIITTHNDDFMQCCADTIYIVVAECVGGMASAALWEEQGEIVPRSGQLQTTGNPATMGRGLDISFDVGSAGPVSLRVYDVTGRAVATLAEGVLQPGRYNARWDGKNGSGRPATPGTYFLRLSKGRDVVVEKIVLLK